MASQPNHQRAVPAWAEPFAPPPQGAPKRPGPRGAIHAVHWRAMDEPDAVRAWDALAQWASEPNPFFESWYLLPIGFKESQSHGCSLNTQTHLMVFQRNTQLIQIFLLPELQFIRWYEGCTFTSHELVIQWIRRSMV